MFHNKKYIQEIINEDKELDELLNKLKAHSEQTYDHVMHTTDKMLSLLPFFKFTDISKKELTVGCLLHDIGKLDVPTEIIDKKDALTESEWNIIKKHPIYGLKYIQNRNLNIRNICLLHHEKLDGSGYPYGYIKEMIPDYCQFITIIDIMDALCSKRSYRDACGSMDEFMDMMRDLMDYSRINISYMNKIKQISEQGFFQIV